MKQRHINVVLTIAALALTTFLIALPWASATTVRPMQAPNASTVELVGQVGKAGPPTFTATWTPTSVAAGTAMWRPMSRARDTASSPTMTAVSPTEAYNFRPTTITLTGANFTATPTVTLGILPLTAHSTNALQTASFTGSAFVNDTILFSPSGSMSDRRQGHTATLLHNGEVLVAGGFDVISGCLNSAELYNPTSGTWSATGSMSIARRWHTATLLNNGKVLAAGHWSVWDFSERTELYDLTTSTWSSTGSMHYARGRHTATLLNNGQVLVAGGAGGAVGVGSAELFDLTLGTWTSTSSMSTERDRHTATLLNNGKVLVVGGYDNSLGRILNSAELYDPTTGAWSTTGNMGNGRYDHTATLLTNGKVLVAGGGVSSAELYDPTSGTWNATGNMTFPRSYHTATLLTNGKVLVAGGGGSSAELYDPTSGTWSLTGSMGNARRWHTATLLNNGKVLVTGGFDANTDALDSTELGAIVPANTLTGTLTLPSGWVNTNPITVQFVATTSGAAPDAGALSNDGSTWGNWVATTPGTTTATTWNVGGDGVNKTVVLRLRDVNGQIATVVTGTVNVDTTKPSSSITALPAFSNATIALSWSGSDALSGISTYDVQVRAGSGGAWTDVLTNTASTSATYNGANGTTYYFRVRARDAAGNLEDWPADYDTFTFVDTEPPIGTITINGGAFDTTSTNVQLTLLYTDTTSGVSQMVLSNDGSIYTSWDSPATSRNWILQAGDGLKTVYVRYKDTAGNVSAVYTDTISLDTTVQPEFGLSINEGALFTNKITVTLSIGAQPGTAQMQVSNEGNFPGATWEPYTAHRSWQVTQYLNYVIPRLVYARYKDVNGSVSSTYLDDIIMDVNPPTGSVSIIGPSSARGLRVLATSVTLSLRAEDDVSGVGAMLISNRPDFAGAAWETYATSRGWTLDSNNTVYVRFRDNAGNVSATYSASRPSNWSVFLPLILK